MKISILGTNGFLSTAIAKYANEKQWELAMYGLDKPVGHTYDTYYKINLMDNDLDCSSLLDSDIVVYAIGAGIQSNLKECTNLIYALNVTVPVTICNKINEMGFRGTFVTFGSYFELGECNLNKPATEEDIITAIAPAPTDYVVSKRMLTRFVTSYKHDYTHWHFIIPTIYGAGENPKRLIPYTINAIRNGEELHFTAGDQIRQYIHVSEIPRLIDLANKNNVSSGIFNIEGKDTLAIHELVTLIFASFGKKLPEDSFNILQRSDVNMKFLALNGAKAKETIGFDAVISLKSSIFEY